MPNITKPTGMSTIWALSGVKTPPSDSKIAQGWVVELPPYQTANFIENKQDQFNAHVNMHGVPVWDSATEYQGGLSYVKGSNGTLYKCLQTNTNSDPTNPLNSNNWAVAFENFGSVAAVQNQLNTHITNYGTLSALTSASTARSNLSVWSRTESDVRYAFTAGSAAQVFSVAAATLGSHAVRLDQIPTLVPYATEATPGISRIATSLQASAGTDDLTFITPLKGAQTYLRRSLNLSDLNSVAAARTNLGLGTIATESAGSFLRASNNLSDVANTTIARSNLGLTSTATQPETYFLRTSLNLSDVPNVVTARANLGLGGAALLNVGTTAGTVAAGNDTRIVNAVQTSRTITAGNGLTGGGSLAADRTLTLGTPGTISANTGNSVTSTSHTHAFDITSFFGERLLAATGFYILPGGMALQWGVGPGLNDDQSATVTLPVPGTILSVQVTGFGSVNASVGPCFITDNWTTTTFRVGNNYGTGAYAFRWFAVVAV